MSDSDEEDDVEEESFPDDGKFSFYTHITGRLALSLLVLQKRII